MSSTNTESSPSKQSAIARWYAGTALVLFNTAVVFVVLNALVYAGYRVSDRLSPASNAVAKKYGNAALVDIYPDMDERSVDALLDETWSRASEFEPYVMFREHATRGKYVNVHEAGFRLSRDQGPWPPAAGRYTVFVFGGSTTFSYGLADEQSLASFLQPALAAALERDVVVYNFASGAYQSTQERVLFQELLVKGSKPDLAIFVDGLNDFAFPHVPMNTAGLRRALQDTSGDRALRVVQRLPIMRLVGGASGGTEERSPLDVDGTDAASDARRRELLDSVVQRYLANKRQIEGVAQQFGVRPVFIWQPIPYYKYDAAYHPFSSPTNRHASAGYLHMQSIVDKQDLGANFVWAADIQEQVKERLYVDAVHYSARMNERLATFIAERIVERGVF
jgi:hypothetical protein